MVDQRKSITYQPFTWQTYSLYLDTALESGYRFISFADLMKPKVLPGFPFVLLRHDIDYDPGWVKPISRLETEKGIRATYFFQVDSSFYEFESAETLLVIKEILRDRHYLGLHFDANQTDTDEEVIEQVEWITSELETRFDTLISAVSFHMPTRRPVKHLRLKNNRINTYSPMFFETIEYVSDSNQDWRGKDILKIFQAGHFRRIQLLIHPIWWRENYQPFAVKLRELAGKLNISVDDILTSEQLALLQ